LYVAEYSRDAKIKKKHETGISPLQEKENGECPLVEINAEDKFFVQKSGCVRKEGG